MYFTLLLQYGVRHPLVLSFIPFTFTIEPNHSSAIGAIHQIASTTNLNPNPFGQLGF